MWKKLPSSVYLPLRSPKAHTRWILPVCFSTDSRAPATELGGSPSSAAEVAADAAVAVPGHVQGQSVMCS